MRVLSFRRMPRPDRRPRRLDTRRLQRWWQQSEAPWWVKLLLGGVLYWGYLILDSNTFDGDEIRHLIVGLILGGLGLKK